VICGIVLELEAGEEDINSDVDGFSRIVQVGSESLVCQWIQDWSCEVKDVPCLGRSFARKA
jgi:hypothetical protein